MAQQTASQTRVTDALRPHQAISLGLINLIAGVFLMSLFAPDSNGSRWLQLAWLLIVFFGTPAGVLLIKEFSYNRWLTLPPVRLILNILGQTWQLLLLLPIPIIAFNPSLALYLFLLPGFLLVALAALEHLARKTQ